MVRRERTPERRRLVRILILAASIGLVIACVVGLVIGLSAPGDPDNSAGPVSTGNETTSPTAPPRPDAGAVVDASMAERGLVPEPITSDAVVYGIEAARALVSFDTTQVSRDQFREYIASWVGNDPRDGPDPEAMTDDRDLTLDEIYNRIIGNSERWASLGLDKSVLTATQTGEVKVDYDHVNSQAGEFDKLIEAGYHSVTVELDVTTTAVQGGKPMVITDPLTVSMQINCSASLPLGETPQVTGDCKIIRYFPEPML